MLPRPLARLLRRVRHTVRDIGAVGRPGFRTTWEGKVFIGATFLIGFAAYNTATNLLYLIFSMMLSMLIVSATLSRSTMKRVTAERLVPSPLVAGQEATVHLRVRNRKRWAPSLSLRLTDVLATGEVMGEAYAVRVPARDSVRLGYRASFPRRGLWVFDRLVISTRYPFGFVEKSQALPVRREVIVYPPVAELGPQFSESSLGLGDVESGRRGLGTSLHGLREYTPSDPARHIHWKVSAKAGKVMLREFEREDKKRVTLHLESEGRESDAEAFEWAVIFCASLCKYLIERDYQVRLVTGQGRVPFGTGAAHLSRLMRSLAIVELKPRADEEAHLQPAHAADSVVLGIQFREEAPTSGHDQVIDTRTWRPESVAAVPLEHAA